MKAFNYNGRRNISGERIRQARTRQRCTQSDLAARVQVSGVIIERDCISRIENGLRMVQDFELRAIAGALGGYNGLAGRGNRGRRKIKLP